MADRAESSAGTPTFTAGTIEPFVLEFVRDHPGCAFGEIVEAARSRLHVSRATVARHLSRLIRFGEITLRPDRTYVPGEAGSAGPKPIIEIRWYDLAINIGADGTSQTFFQLEFRVVSGTLDHIDFLDPKPIRQFLWWSTLEGELREIPASRTPERRTTHWFTFARPLTARTPTWHRICMNLTLPRWYRMAYVPRGRATVGETTPARDQESESIEIGTHARLFEQRLSPDAYFRLQLVFPAGYPLGPIRSVVRLKHEPDKFDSAEGLRLEALARSTKDGDGFRRAGAAVTLSVPAPKINRHYEIVWDLPTKRARRAWLAAERRRMADD